MTPFGQKIRELRARKGVSQKEMAAAIGVSAAYLSALEHGRRGLPTWPMIQKIIGYFNVIWDDAEELQRLAETSHPRIVIDTSGQPAWRADRRARRERDQALDRPVEHPDDRPDALKTRTTRADPSAFR
jgi:transcriptional regulator with XRE-family HTH domain